MLKDITFGQYIERDSKVHKLDPRTKILLLITIITLIFVSSGFVSLSAIILFVLFIIIISKIPLKLYLKNLKAILPIVLFTSLINIFYTKTGNALLEITEKIKITDDGIFTALYLTLRILLLILASSSLTYTTTPNDLTDGIESLCTPLKFIGLKNVIHTMALMMTIALRFIPTLVEETEKIMNAQKARGADMENGSLKQRIKALIPILIPLFISAVRRSYELAEAMECRCYNGGEGRRRMKQLTLKSGDYISFILGLVLIGAVVILNILKVGF